MPLLRRVSYEDEEVLAERCGMSGSETREMIGRSEAGSFEGRFFEMYAVVSGGQIVGLISLYGTEPSAVSIGPEIFEEYRGRGLAKAAMREAMEIARSKGFGTVRQQIRCDNAASIALHRGLGFKTDGAVFKNRKQNDVCFFVKSL